MYTPKPPCFKIKCCDDNCEKSSFCTQFGKFGMPSLNKYRAQIMMSAIFVSFICMVLSIVALFSLSSKNQDIRNTSWTYGIVEGGGKIYVGLNQIVVDFADGHTSSAVWGSGTCDNLEVTASQYCSDCQSACDASVGVVIVSLITTIPTLTTDIQRSTVRGDMNCQKFMGIFTGILGCVSTMAALSAYAEGCNKHLPGYIDGHSAAYHYGPGFICLVIATLLKAYDVMVHILMPVVPFDEGEYLTNSDGGNLTKKLSETDSRNVSINSL